MPVCKPNCVDTCATSTLTCTNTTKTVSVCNYACAVPPSVPLPEITPIVPAPAPVKEEEKMAYKAPYRRRLFGDKKVEEVVAEEAEYESYESYGKMAHYVPVSEKVPHSGLRVPAELPPLPVCEQTCKNETGYTVDCVPTSCSKLVNKTRIEETCEIQCTTPPAMEMPVAEDKAEKASDEKVLIVTVAPEDSMKDMKEDKKGRRRMLGESDVSYTPISYSETPGAQAIPEGVVAPQCQQVCTQKKVTYEDYECLDKCKGTDCSGPATCECAEVDEEDDKESKADKPGNDILDFLSDIVKG